MFTQIKQINQDSLAEAKRWLESGESVAFPTETVYGLGGDARRDDSVRKIYEIKGRPSDNPLIVHVHKDFDLSSLVYDERPYAAELRKAFLPGPLTLVYKSRGAVSNLVSCGLDTLAVRVPSHAGAQEFLKFVDMPIAAPSANISKHISPVSAEHVYEDLKGKLPLILDGGRCTGGIESTVCDVTGEYPVVLRTGLVSAEMIAQVTGKCDVYIPKSGERVRSPGMKYKHYAPKCRTRLFSSEQLNEAHEEFLSLQKSGLRVFVLCEESELGAFPEEYVLNLGNTEKEMAANLYELLHKGEKIADVIVAIEPKKKDGVMAGVLNRLTKACAEE
ncbi:MAG TPA: threonylcarbamoyl-AMP synthase [Candidatus Borkfalkia avistercoris]|uniref:Threonylcarbamoyl-AMP synthase n=1 Tax=Candidatus Borkfalkia avistercoris TaxID=2838504 RepID=A0A9D2CZL3_9FIRM|nr:threonylcarbamoyl-AMP synthase [Candidatus Borkfalkia avistercoris]